MRVAEFVGYLAADVLPGQVCWRRTNCVRKR